MRDLKHLIYFENLLQEANNDLVKQAKSDGKLALGYTCYFMPEVLLDLPGRTVTLSLSINTEVCAVMDYFEIFMGRMLLCRKAAEKLGLQFKLMINEQQLI